MLKSIFGKIWASPTTLIGLSVAFAGLPFARKEKIRIFFAHNAICFDNHPFLRGPAKGQVAIFALYRKMVTENRFRKVSLQMVSMMG